MLLQVILLGKKTKAVMANVMPNIHSFIQQVTGREYLPVSSEQAIVTLVLTGTRLCYKHNTHTTYINLTSACGRKILIHPFKDDEMT